MSNLPYRTESLDDIPESARELYTEQDGAYVLPVDGVVPKDTVAGLESSLKKLKEEKNEIKSMNDKDRERLQKYEEAERKREEEKAKKEGRWDELREKLKQEHESEKAKILKEREEERGKLQTAVERLTVTNELRRAIGEAGFPAEYQEAVEAMFLRRNPKVEWDGDTPAGVFPDELHGSRPIEDVVKEFAASEAAEPFLPRKTGSGGGGDGKRSRGGVPDKPYSEMTPDEKADYLDAKYKDV